MMKNAFISALLCLGFFQCAKRAEPPKAREVIPALNPMTDYHIVSGQETVSDIARFLAGKPVQSGERLSAWQVQNGSYQAHALEFDYLWRKRTVIRNYDQTLYFFNVTSTKLGSPSTVVYPFGGPDILHANAVFPTARTYVLLGLEEVGGVPDVMSSDPTPLLHNLRKVLEEPLTYGYYITEQMRAAPPATAIMMTTLGLSGAQVQSVNHIDAAGRPGVEIRFRTAGGINKRAIYVKANLANGGFDSHFQQWLGRYSGNTVYFKAASYLMHDSGFSTARGWFLANSRNILQDDSGIPFRYFSLQEWDIMLLGSYDRPIDLFSKFYQKDLHDAYQSLGGSGPRIPYGSGYHLKSSEANLQIFHRR